MKIKSIITICISLLFISINTMAQTKKEYFSKSSSQIKDDKEYGVLNIAADKKTVVIGTILAYGDGIKGLFIRINNGFPFKLAPAQNGATLNYVGSNLNIVLQPGDKAKIELSNSGLLNGDKQLYATWEITE